MTDFEDVLDKVGHFGKYQMFIYFACLVTVGAAGATINLTIVFYAATPDHWCRNPSVAHLNLTRDVQFNLTIPKEYMNGEETYSRCLKYDVDFSNWTKQDVELSLAKSDYFIGLLNVTACDVGWEYDDSLITSSIVTDWDLVCDHKVLVDVVKSVFMAGFMVGVTLFSFISDWFGRRPAFISSLVMEILCALLIIVSPNYLTFLLLRFLIGVALLGNYTVTFVLATELIGTRSRTKAAPIMGYVWSGMVMLVAGVAYLLRRWRHLALALTVPLIPMLLLCFIVPESPRWLYANGKHDRADIIVRKMAKMNGVVLPEKLNVEVKNDKSSSGVFLDLLRYPKLRRLTLVVGAEWCIMSMVYYALSLNSSELGGNPYVNFLIGGSVDFLGSLVCQGLLQIIGRRTALIANFVLGGLSLFCVMLVPRGLTWATIFLAMFGRFCIGNSFLVMYTYTLELFPTVVRNVGMASGSASARVGGILAPYIGSLVSVNQYIPYTIFGVTSIIAGILLFLLPETKGRKMPETIADGEKVSTSMKKKITPGTNDSNMAQL